MERINRLVSRILNEREFQNIEEANRFIENS